MKKSTKIGLFSSGLYLAGSLAIPAFANQVIEQPVFHPVDVTQINTLEQAKDVYDSKLAEYAGDMKIESREIAELAKIKDVEVSFVEKEILRLEKEGAELTEKVKYLDTEIESYKKNLATLDAKLQNPDGKEILEKNLERLEKEILFFYPGLIKKGKFSVVYDGETKLTEDMNEPFQEIFKETNKILKDYYSDTTLDEGKFYFDIRSVLIVYNVLSEKIASLPENTDGYEAKKKKIMLEKQTLTEKLNNLEAEKAVIVNSEPMKQLESELKPLQEKLEQTTSSRAILKKYDGAVQKIEAYKSGENKDYSKFISISFVPDLAQSNEYDKALAETRKSLDEAVKSVVDIDVYFKEQGFDVELVDKLSNPARTKLPLWLGLPLAVVGPIFRNMLILSYLGGGKQSSDDYGGSALIGFCEGLIGAAFVDGLHPLVLPIRMVATPIVWHGILRATGGDKIYDYARR